jgi:Na+-driven multidrug efflux pump
MFQVPLGISISVGIKVGNQLGAGNPEEAMTTSRVAIKFN